MTRKFTLREIKSIFISLGLIVCTLATNLSAQTLFTENFEGVATTAVLPNGGWTSYDVTAGNSIWGIGASGCIITGTKSMFVCRASITNLCDYAPASITNKIAYKTFSSTGYNTLLLSFKWKCVGEIIGTTLYDYGKVCYSTNGTTWTDLSANYQGQSATQTVTNLALPAALNNIGTVYLGFRWINDGSTKNIPGFVVDDITVTATALPGCSGTPAAGTTVSSSNPACTGSSVTFSLSGATSGTGITYQWQSSPDNITYTNISGATLSTYATAISTAGWWRCLVTCTNSTLSAISTPVNQTLTPFYNCYCTASYTNGCSIDYISNVQFGSINNTTTCTGSTPSNRTLYLSPNPTFYRGFTYPLSITTGGDIEGMRAWVDWNQNVAFANGESVIFGGPTSNPLTTTGNVTIPTGAALGQTVMRVLCRYNVAVGAGGACNSFDFGETEDYLITIADAPSCSGTPVSGTAVSTLTSACTTTSFTLSLSGASVENGIAYQWQSAPDVSGVPGTFINISGANSSTYTTTQTSTNWYRCFLTCTNTSLSSTSTSVKVINAACVNMTNGSSVTCAGNFYDSGGPSVDYANNENYVYTFYPDAGNQARVTWNSFVSESGFDYITIYNGPSTSSPILYGPQSGTLSIPSFTSTDISGALTFRFTSDASIPAAGWDANISCIPNPACSGTPAASGTVASANPACYNTSFTLTLSTSYQYSGITFQWQSAPDVSGVPGTFANISGATSYMYSPTQTASALWYHCIITCTNGNQSVISSNLKVTTQLCYCDPVYSTGCANDKITNLVLNSLSNNSGTTCVTSPAGYSVYGTNPANLTTTLVKGNTYTATITVTTGNANGTGVAAWIDYNDNGVFDATENYNNGATKFASNTTGTLSISVPVTAPTGLHRMRVRSMRNTLSNAIDPCIAGNANGETEDYYVTIAPCGASATGTSPICQYANDNLTATYFGNGIPVSYVWSGPNGFSASGSTATVNNIQPAGAGVYTVTITDDASCVAEGTYTIAVTPGPSPTANSNAPVCEGDVINFTSNNIASGQNSGNSFSWSGPNSFSSTQQNPNIPSASAVHAGVYTVVITNQFLCTRSASETVSVNQKPVPSISSQTNASCNGYGDGQVDINATGGFPNPDYLFTDGSTFNTDGIFTSLVAGLYTITVTDDNNCSNDINVTITEPAVLTAAPASPTTCDGSIATLSSNPAGGTSPYSYSWTGPNSFSSTSANPSFTATAADAGTYTVTLSDVNGCVSSGYSTVLSIEALPTANANTDQNVCSTSTISLNGSTGGSATGGTWSTAGDGTFNNASVMNAVYTPGANDIAAGSVVLTLTTSGSSVCSPASDNMTVSFDYALSQPTAISGAPLSVCPPQNGISLSVSGDPGADSYNWYMAPGTNNVTFNPPSSTNTQVVDLGITTNSGYTIRVEASNACGTSPYRAVFIRRSSSIPVAISGESWACGNDVKIYSISSVLGATSYEWLAPAGCYFDGLITNVSPYITNSLSVTITFPSGYTGGAVGVASQVACYTSPYKYITVNNAPSVPSLIAGNAGVCPPVTESYSVTNTSGLTYNWIAPANASIASGAGTNSVTVDYLSGFSGGQLKVSASSACGTSAERKLNISLASGISARPSAINGQISNLCGATGVVFTALPLTAGATYTFSTSVAGAIVSPGPANNQALIDFPASGWNKATVSVIMQKTCSSPSPSRTIDIKGAPGTDIISGPSAAGSGQTGVQYNVSLLTPAVTYGWTLPSGSVITNGAGTNAITVTFGSNSGYIICNRSNACGNSSAKLFVTVSAPRLAGSPSFEAAETDISIYPNPSSDYLNIEFTSTLNEPSEIILADISGRLVYKSLINSVKGYNSHVLDLSSFSKGIYMLQLNVDGKNISSRIVIE